MHIPTMATAMKAIATPLCTESHLPSMNSAQGTKDQGTGKGKGWFCSATMWIIMGMEVIMGISGVILYLHIFICYHYHYYHVISCDSWEVNPPAVRWTTRWLICPYKGDPSCSGCFYRHLLNHPNDSGNPWDPRNHQFWANEPYLKRPSRYRI